MNIICRDVDRSLVESVLSGAAEDYKKKNGKSVKLTVDPKNKLPPPPQGNRPGWYCCFFYLLTFPCSVPSFLFVSLEHMSHVS